MATLLFLILKAARVIETSHDWYFALLLVALELPQWVRIVVHLRGR